MSLEPRDYFVHINTRCLSMIENEYERIRKDCVKKAYNRLQDIVCDNLRTQANFMYSFIENELDVPLKYIFKNAIKSISNDLVAITNNTIRKLENSGISDIDKTLNMYEASVTDRAIYHVNLDTIAFSYADALNRKLKRTFEYINSNQTAEDIDRISRESLNYINKMVEEMQFEMSGVVRSVNDQQKNVVLEFRRDMEKSLVQTSPDKRYTESFDEYTFEYNGKIVKYSCVGNNYICTVNGQKVTDPNNLLEINRELQEKFPEANMATDSMIRHIADMVVDNRNEVSSAKSLPGNIFDANFDYDEYKKSQEPVVSDKEIDEMLSAEVPVNPNASNDDNPGALTREEIEALLGDLVIPGMEKDEEIDNKKDESFESMQKEIDKLEQDPKVQRYIYLMEQMKKSYNEYKETVEGKEEIKPSISMM